MRHQMILAGIGGQGVLFATKLLAESARRQGLAVIGSETHGMSQRGGSVVSHLKVGGFSSPMVEEINVVDEDRDKAVELQERACELEHEASCLDLATRYFEQNDLTRAQYYYDRVCTLGDPIGCQWREKLQSDEFKCLELRQSDGPSCRRACTDGNASCCLKMGEMAQLGHHGVEESMPEALTYYAKACELDSYLGCFHMAHHYHVGAEESQRDIHRAISFYEKSCELRPPVKQISSDKRGRLMWEVSTSCLELALIFNNPDQNAPPGSVERDVKKAKSYLTRSCDLGVDYACELLDRDIFK